MKKYISQEDLSNVVGGVGEVLVTLLQENGLVFKEVGSCNNDVGVLCREIIVFIGKPIGRIDPE